MAHLSVQQYIKELCFIILLHPSIIGPYIHVKSHHINMHMDM